MKIETYVSRPQIKDFLIRKRLLFICDALYNLIVHIIYFNMPSYKRRKSNETSDLCF